MASNENGCITLVLLYNRTLGVIGRDGISLLFSISELVKADATPLQEYLEQVT